MNKQELVTKVLADNEKDFSSKAAANRVVDSVLNTIKETVANGEDVAIVGFGTFSVAERAARSGVNPSTGEKIQIPATKVPKFKAGKAFRDAIKK